MSPPLDFAFVTHRRSEGWILHAICRRLAERCGGSSQIVFHDAAFADARTYFFSHWRLYIGWLRRFPEIRSARSIVFFTHPSGPDRLQPELIAVLNGAQKVAFMNSAAAADLINQGLRRDLVHVVHGAADRDRFRPHLRGHGGVGVISRYYARKNPSLLFDVIHRMRHRRFILLGDGWEGAPGFDAVRGLGHVEYRQLEYEQYPRAYRGMDVFFSPSLLEGGPIPLLETMMSDIVPVVSRTGFAPDLIRHGRNGFLFDTSGDVETPCTLIDRAFGLPSGIRRTVRHLTWDRFARRVLLEHPCIGQSPVSAVFSRLRDGL